MYCSLRGKRFRGVGEKRKTEERDFRCFARLKLKMKPEPKKEREEGKETVATQARCMELESLGWGERENNSCNVNADELESAKTDKAAGIQSVTHNNPFFHLKDLVLHTFKNVLPSVN